MNPTELSALLEKLVAQPRETEWLEFKTNYGDPEGIGQRIAALANSAKLGQKKEGFIVWGVADKTHEIVGTHFSIKSSKKGNQELESWLANLLNPRVHFDVYEWDYEDKRIVLLKVEVAFVGAVAFKNVRYIRVNSTLEKLNKYPAKEKKLWVSEGHHGVEKTIIEGNLGAIDITRLLNYAAFFRLRGKDLPPSPQGIVNILEKFDVVKRDENSNYGITYAGALLFANQLIDFPQLGSKRIRFIKYPGKNKIDEPSIDDYGSMGYAVGFQAMIKFINSLLPNNKAIEDAVRVKVEQFPEIALREIIVNALIHQDFGESGIPPVIEVFTDRIEVSNNGIPLIDTKRFIDEMPRSRNELIVKIMRDVGICEKRGSGVDRIVNAAEIFQLPPPDFVAKEKHTTAILYGPRPFSKMTRSERIRACYQHACLKHVAGQMLTNQSIRNRFSLTNNSTASKIISATVDEGLIVPVEQLKGSRSSYVPFWANQ